MSLVDENPIPHTDERCPRCGKPCYILHDGPDYCPTNFRAECCGALSGCGYRGPITKKSPAEAIRLHNLLAQSAHPPKPEPTEARELNLKWGRHDARGDWHIEWHAPCGCAYHPEPKPHVHPCIKHSPIEEAPKPPAEWQMVPDSLVKFLLGEGEYMGQNFGENIGRAPYWWRKYLREAAAPKVGK